MSNEWIELKTGKEVFDRAADGWEIELRGDATAPWQRWSRQAWVEWVQYRGRPPQPKTKEVVLRVPVLLYDDDIYVVATPRSENNASGQFIAYLDEIPHRWEGGKLIVEVKE